MIPSIPPTHSRRITPTACRDVLHLAFSERRLAHTVPQKHKNTTTVQYPNPRREAQPSIQAGQKLTKHESTEEPIETNRSAQVSASSKQEMA